MNWPAKDPDANLDYSLDWTAWLAGDTIAASSWVIPDGLEAGTMTNNDTVATIWLSGGAPGSTYKITNQITTAAGRTDERTVTLRVVEQ
jgi:hypothetical protein